MGMHQCECVKLVFRHDCPDVFVLNWFDVKATNAGFPPTVGWEIDRDMPPSMCRVRITLFVILHNAVSNLHRQANAAAMESLCHVRPVAGRDRAL
eukprot:15851090-Heterocapsa_arctica.AAC.1